MRTLPFALFHGTSNWYGYNFRPGEVAKGWPHRDEALALLNGILAGLTDADAVVEFWMKETMSQSSGHANWRHGSVCVTPSRYTASKYARTGASNGGELVTMCACALERLSKLDNALAERLVSGCSDNIRELLAGGGTPALVVYERVPESDLEAERGIETVQDVLARLSDLDDAAFDVISQQSNFLLKPGRGVVTRLEAVGER